MRNVRTTLTVEIMERVEVAPGVFEWSAPKLVPLKATQQGFTDERRDRAMLDGLVINARFKVRGLPDGEVEYAHYKGRRYKVHSVYHLLRDHYAIIELGELV